MSWEILLEAAKYLEHEEAGRLQDITTDHAASGQPQNHFTTMHSSTAYSSNTGNNDEDDYSSSAVSTGDAKSSINFGDGKSSTTESASSICPSQGAASLAQQQQQQSQQEVDFAAMQAAAAAQNRAQLAQHQLLQPSSHTALQSYAHQRLELNAATARLPGEHTSEIPDYRVQMIPADDPENRSVAESSTPQRRLVAGGGYAGEQPSMTSLLPTPELQYPPQRSAGVSETPPAPAHQHRGLLAIRNVVSPASAQLFIHQQQWGQQQHQQRVAPHRNPAGQAASQHQLMASPPAQLTVAAAGSHCDDESRYNILQFRQRKMTMSLTHNQLEKNRRAHLKECFDTLKRSIPRLGTRRSSNLTILKAALRHIQMLKRKSMEYNDMKKQLMKRRQERTERLDALKHEICEYVEPTVLHSYLEAAVKTGPPLQARSASISSLLTLPEEEDLQTTSTASEAEEEEMRLGVSAATMKSTTSTHSSDPDSALLFRPTRKQPAAAPYQLEASVKPPGPTQNIPHPSAAAAGLLVSGSPSNTGWNARQNLVQDSAATMPHHRLAAQDTVIAMPHQLTRDPVVAMPHQLVHGTPPPHRAVQDNVTDELVQNAAVALTEQGHGQDAQHVYFGHVPQYVPLTAAQCATPPEPPHPHSSDSVRPMPQTRLWCGQPSGRSATPSPPSNRKSWFSAFQFGGVGGSPPLINMTSPETAQPEAAAKVVPRPIEAPANACKAADVKATTPRNDVTPAVATHKTTPAAYGSVPLPTFSGYEVKIKYLANPARFTSPAAPATTTANNNQAAPVPAKKRNLEQKDSAPPSSSGTPPTRPGSNLTSLYCAATADNLGADNDVARPTPPPFHAHWRKRLVNCDRKNWLEHRGVKNRDKSSPTKLADCSAAVVTTSGGGTNGAPVKPQSPTSHILSDQEQHVTVVTASPNRSNGTTSSYQQQLKNYVPATANQALTAADVNPLASNKQSSLTQVSYTTLQTQPAVSASLLVSKQQPTQDAIQGNPPIVTSSSSQLSTNFAIAAQATSTVELMHNRESKQEQRMQQQKQQQQQHIVLATRNPTQDQQQLTIAPSLASAAVHTVTLPNGQLAYQVVPAPQLSSGGAQPVNQMQNLIAMNRSAAGTSAQQQQQQGAAALVALPNGVQMQPLVIPLGYVMYHPQAFPAAASASSSLPPSSGGAAATRVGNSGPSSLTSSRTRTNSEESSIGGSSTISADSCDDDDAGASKRRRVAADDDKAAARTCCATTKTASQQWTVPSGAPPGGGNLLMQQGQQQPPPGRYGIIECNPFAAAYHNGADGGHLSNAVSHVQQQQPQRPAMSAASSATEVAALRYLSSSTVSSGAKS